MIRTAHITKNTILTTTAELAFKHARLTGPYPAGEAIISTDPICAAWYAKYVLKGPFPLGEPAIFKDARMSQWYQEEVLDRDWVSEARVCDATLSAFGLENYPK